MTKLFISCALPYANGATHLGHLRSTYIPADIFARYHRMIGNDVLLVCATDEHGTPIAVRADKENKKPVDIATRYHKMIAKDLELCDISLDNFGRTSDAIHYKDAQKFFLKLYNEGFIYEKEIKQLYCENCNKSLPDRYVEGICPYCESEARGDHCEVCGRHLEPVQLKEPHCLTCGETPIIKESTQYFFKLSHFQKEVETWILGKEDLPSNVKNYAKQWLNDGLKDWIITRDMEWGIPVPLDCAEGKIIYVWAEALVGYLSSAMEWTRKTGEDWKPYWDDKRYHFIGKDIIYHHAIFWPAMLMGHECQLPTNIIAGEYLSLEGQKMSTSKNWVIWAADFVKKFDSDLLRYYLTINAPLNKDTDFSWDDFQRRINDELADVLGNFLHRTFTFTRKFFDSKVPEASELNDTDKKFQEAIETLPGKVSGFIEECKFREGLTEIMKVVKMGNKYFHSNEPWRTIKENPSQAATTLYLCNQLTKTVTILLKPYIPNTVDKSLDILNIDHDIKWSDSLIPLPVGHEINKAKPLFKKIEDDVIAQEKEELYKNLENKKDDKMDDNLISIDDFGAMDLRVGEILEAEPIEKSNKLLKLKVNVGEKELQIVAGIAKNYEIDELINRKVIAIVNLKPAKLFGVKSEGMLLATSDNVVLLSAEGANIGEKIQ